MPSPPLTHRHRLGVDNAKGISCKSWAVLEGKMVRCELEKQLGLLTDDAALCSTSGVKITSLGVSARVPPALEGI